MKKGYTLGRSVDGWDVICYIISIDIWKDGEDPIYRKKEQVFCDFL